MTDAHDRKARAALASIAASALLTLGKFAAGLASGSLSLISESGHSLLDTGATILTYFAVRASAEPADDEHHYGHGKVEAVAALAETGLLMILAAGVLFIAARRLVTHDAEPIDAGWPVFAVLVVSIGVDVVRFTSLRKIANETKSEALAADALHFSSDLMASVCVLLGLTAAAFGFRQGDTLAALAVALFIGTAGWRLGRRTIDTLVDTAPAGLAERMRARIANVPGVVQIESIRLRPVGGVVIGEVSVGVSRSLPLVRVATIKDAIGRALRSEEADCEITITADPVALDNESILEQVLLIAARRRAAVHHVTVQSVGGVKSISFDIELDGDMPLGRAHEIASALEGAIKSELGAELEVDSHIEPMEIDELAGHDVAQERADDYAQTLSRLAAASGLLRDVHNVRARDTRQGVVVNYHCRADPALSVNAVHDAVDLIDHGMRDHYTDLARVVGHAEPPDA